MTIGAMIKQLSMDLADAEPGYGLTRWKEEQLLSYIREGFALSFPRRPELFIRRKIIKADHCNLFNDACDCDTIRRVIGQVTEDGHFIKQLKPKTVSATLRWPGKDNYRDPNNFYLEEYYIDNVAKSIWLYPKVPYGIDVYVMIECSVFPTDFSDGAEYNQEITAAVMQWALYRAKMVEGEDNPSIADMAKTHGSMFFQLLNLQKEEVSIEAEEDY